jgi:hypothetical protein
MTMTQAIAAHQASPHFLSLPLSSPLKSVLEALCPYDGFAF